MSLDTAEKRTEIIIIYTAAASEFIAHIWLNKDQRDRQGTTGRGGGVGI